MTTAQVLFLQYQVLPPLIKAELRKLILEGDEAIPPEKPSKARADTNKKRE
jgi:hypothetical protein